MNENLIKIGQTAHRNSPAILTAFGVTGVVMTSVLAARASWKASKIIQEEIEEHGEILDIQERVRAYVPLIWHLYIPPAISGATTVGAIWYGAKTHSSRTAAAVSAYTLTERAFSEYKAKVVEEVGKHRESVFRDDLVTSKLDGQVPKQDVTVIGSGAVLCCELYTGRYFMSDMETLRKAQNDINAIIIGDLYVSLDSFYDVVGLPPTTHSNELGWDSDKLLDIQFSTVISDDGRPCLAFNYNYVKPL